MPLNQDPENKGEIHTSRRQRKEMTTFDDFFGPYFGHESNGINRIRRKKHPETMTK